MNGISKIGGLSSQGERKRRTPAQLAACVATSIQRGNRLLEDGYRYVPLPAQPSKFGVYKPGQKPGDRPAYIVQLWEDGQRLDTSTGELIPILRYHCSCPLFAEQSRHQEYADGTWRFLCEVLGLDGPVCKHGERLVAEMLKAIALADHFRAGARTFSVAEERGGSFAVAPNTSSVDDQGVSFRNSDLPWATRRASRKRDVSEDRPDTTRGDW